MKAIAENLYERGKHGIKYVRRRIPAAVRQAYPKKPISRAALVPLTFAKPKPEPMLN